MPFSVDIWLILVFDFLRPKHGSRHDCCIGIPRWGQGEDGAINDAQSFGAIDLEVLLELLHSDQIQGVEIEIESQSKSKLILSNDDRDQVVPKQSNRK